MCKDENHYMCILRTAQQPHIKDFFLGVKMLSVSFKEEFVYIWYAMRKSSLVLSHTLFKLNPKYGHMKDPTCCSRGSRSKKQVTQATWQVHAGQVSTALDVQCEN